MQETREAAKPQDMQLLGGGLIHGRAQSVSTYADSAAGQCTISSFKKKLVSSKECFNNKYIYQLEIDKLILAPLERYLSLQ